MPKVTRLASLRRQALGILGDNAAVGREPGSADIGNQLAEEVSQSSSILIPMKLTCRSDLNHSNQYIVGLALVTLGNIASVEMSRDLFPEVETIISSANPYIRRKAALCAMRICRKVPDLQEHFVEKAKILLSDRNHGVLLCGLTLVTSMCEADEAEGGENGVVDMFRPLVPAMVKVLKALASSGYTAEHDVNGISDPFVQVKILRLFRVLARGDAETSEQINDILAQVSHCPSQVHWTTSNLLFRLPPIPTVPRTLAIPFSTRLCSPFWKLRPILD
jgi:hypothetical protein